MAEAPLLQLDQVEARGRGGLPLFQGVDLRVAPQHRWLILGRSGTGKSTLLRMAARLIPPAAGEVRWSPPPGPFRSAFAFRDTGLLSALTLGENLTLPLRYGGQDPAPALDPVVEALGLGLWLESRPHQLSPALRRLANLGRALAYDPDLVFLDDPLGDLDPQTHVRAHRALEAFLGQRPRTLVLTATEPTPYEAIRGLHRALLGGGRLKLLGDLP